MVSSTKIISGYGFHVNLKFFVRPTWWNTFNDVINKKTISGYVCICNAS